MYTLFIFYCFFIILIFLSSLIIPIIYFIKKKKFMSMNKINHICLVIAIIFVVVCLLTNNFQRFENTLDIYFDKIIVVSLILINCIIITFAILIWLIIPFRIFFNMKSILSSEQNIYKLKVYLKLLCTYGVIAIITCSLIYSFNTPGIKFDNNIALLENSSSVVVGIYSKLNEIMKIIFTTNYLSWVYLSFFFLVILISYLYLRKGRFLHSFESKFKKVNNYSKFITCLTPLLAFCALVCALLLGWESMVSRVLVLFLLIIIFFILVYTINLIYMVIIKKEKFKNVVNEIKFIDKTHNYLVKKISVSDLKKFFTVIIYPLFLMAYLALSSKSMLSWSNPFEHISFWLSLFFASILNIFIYSFKYTNELTSKYFLSLNTSYLMSGANSSLIIYLNPILSKIGTYTGSIIATSMNKYHSS